MNGTRVILLLALLLTLLSAGTSHATVRQLPVTFHSTAMPEFFEVGKDQHLELLMTVRYPAVVSDIRLEGRSWTVAQVVRTLVEAKDDLETYRLEFDLSTTDPDQPLDFSYELDGETVILPVDFSSARLRGDKMRSSTVVETADLPQRSDSNKAIDAPFEPMAPAARLFADPAETGPAPSDKVLPQEKVARWINVSGGFGYFQGITFKPAYGATVIILADTWGPDTLLGSGRVDVDGNFDIDVAWLYDPLDPDIYVMFLAGNSTVTVTPDNDTWYDDSDTYSWRTENYSQVEGASLDIGTHAAEGGAVAALQLASSVQRANAWLYYMSGYTNIPQVHLHWPIPGDRSYYTVTGGTWVSPDEYRIYTGSPDSWEESTVIHEYGHHFVHVFGDPQAADYCNGVCDDNGCGHCLWCPEDYYIAFSEGFPDWMSDAVTRDWVPRYGFQPLFTYNFERAEECTTNFEYPYNTEGFFAALLRDIEDPWNEDDSYSTGYRDQLNLNAADILEVVDVDRPVSSTGFIEAFRTRHLADTKDYWETLMNNGFDGLDTQGPVTGPLMSSSHEPYVLSTNNAVELNVLWVTDDFSGLGGYSLSANPGMQAIVPGTTINFPAGDPMVIHLAPGSYTFSVRAIDRAGNADPNYTTFGPVSVREPDPGDLRPEGRTAGWDYPLVPKDTQGADGSNVHVDTSPLYSNTYWNASLINYGEATTPGANAGILVDGLQEAYFNFSDLDGGYYYYLNNRGPIAMPSGRHTMELFVDSGGAVAEPNETDNRFGHQWVWIPDLLTHGTVHTRTHPPLKDGGFASVSGQSRWYNCDGLSLFTVAGGMPSPWAVVAAHTVSNRDDVDVRLHDAATGAQAGYDFPLAISGRPEGYIDAVLVNAANRPATSYAIGVLNNHPYGMGSDYRAQVEYGEELTPSAPTAATLALNEGLALYTYEATASGSIRIDLQTEIVNNPPPLYVAWYGRDFTVGGLLDYDATGATDFQGGLHMDVDVEPGTYGLIVWRDPVEMGFGGINYTITVGPPAPDLAGYTPVGWDAPVIPAPGQFVTPTFGPEPSGLWGETASTYLNLAVENLSATTSTPYHMGTYVDGTLVQETYLGSLAGGNNATVIPTTPLAVRGGRHLVAMVADRREVISETDEMNNAWGSQYVWRPTAIGLGGSTQRSAPPNPTGDWDRVSTQEVLYYNCDGIKTTDFLPVGNTGRWGSVAILPGEFTDLDLRLHEPHVGARTGFDIPLVESHWPLAQSDFVLMNFRNTPLRHFEAGIVLGETTKVEDYTVSSSASVWGGTDPRGEIGTYSFAAGEMLDLMEFEFATEGYFTVTLDNVDPALDLGISLYGPDQEYYAKEDAFDLGSAAWLQPAGGSENFNFRIDAAETGYYCLAIWKVAAVDGPISGSYTVSIDFVPNLPDVATAQPSGWDAPVVPRPTMDATYTWAELPATLPGDTAGTFFNYAHTSYGYTDPGYFELKVEVSGVTREYSNLPGTGVGYTYHVFGDTPHYVVAGRHTLNYFVDWSDELDELDEVNNIYGAQYVWEPQVVALGVSTPRLEPEAFSLGWENVTEPGQLWPNCDAIRTPVFEPENSDSYYGVVALINEELSDPDLNLHTPSLGLTDGFTEPLVSSNWSAGHIDFVLMNFNVNPARQFDVGIVNSEYNGEDLWSVVDESIFHSANTMGSLGDHVLATEELIDVHEMGISNLGTYRVDLTSLDANCNLGLSLYGPDADYYAKSDVFDDPKYGGAISYLAAAGENESIDFTIDTPGYYALAVWKVGTADLYATANYNLKITYGGASGVEEELPTPTVTRLAGAYPNPFNPMTTVAFELDETQTVRLEIFDLRGRLVHTLADETLSAGRYERIWRGSDRSGRNVASGVYMIKMTAGTTVELKRISLLK